MRSFRLSTPEPGPPPADGFVSFKTIPDEDKARSLAERLKDDGFKVTFIHGDTACSHPFGSKEANRWIKQLLSAQHYRVLLSIASEDSLRSPWVFQEFYEGTQKCPLIILLWYGGPDPTAHFFPPPSWLTRRLPAIASTYLVDCRSNPEDAARIAASIFAQMPKMVRTCNLLRIFVVIGGLLLYSLAVVLVLYLVQPPDDRILAIQQNEMVKAGIDALLRVIFIATILVFPTLRLPKGLSTAGNVRKTSSSFSVIRFGLASFFALALFGSITMGLSTVPIHAVVGAIWAVAWYIIIRGLRRMLILRSYRRSATAASLAGN
jgi:hypothetical protein